MHCGLRWKQHQKKWERTEAMESMLLTIWQSNYTNSKEKPNKSKKLCTESTYLLSQSTTGA